jgi:hypothetical protein
MTTKRNEILTNLYQSKELADLLKKMQPENLREDIKQELFVILCEMPEERILMLEEKKQLKFYTVRIVMNMVLSKKSRFYYKFRKTLTASLPDIAATQAENDFDLDEFENSYAQRILKMNKAIENLHWYQREVLEQYLEHGSAGKLIKDMKEKLGGRYIPKRSILQTVKTAKEEIRAKIASLPDIDNSQLNKTA